MTRREEHHGAGSWPLGFAIGEVTGEMLPIVLVMGRLWSSSCRPPQIVITKLSLREFPSEPRCEPAFVWPVEQIAATWAAPFINFTQFLFSFLLEVTRKAEGLGG